MGIPAKRIIGEWKKSPSFQRAYDKLDGEFWIARLLIHARARAGLTQEQVATRMHTTQSVIARLESGKQKPSLATLEKYAKATRAELRIDLVS